MTITEHEPVTQTGSDYPLVIPPRQELDLPPRRDIMLSQITMAGCAIQLFLAWLLLFGCVGLLIVVGLFS